MAEGEIPGDELLEGPDIEDIIGSKSPLSDEEGSKSFRVSAEIDNVWPQTKFREVPGAHSENLKNVPGLHSVSGVEAAKALEDEEEPVTSPTESADI
jgi:hypothetical protein